MIETIHPEQLDCGEGPMWDSDARRLYWTNAVGQAIYSYDRSAEAVTTLTESVQAGSITVHADGGLLLGGGKGFYHWKSDGDIRVVADSCDDKPVAHINDIIADPSGRVFGGPESYNEEEPYEPGYLYCIDLDGSIRIVEEGLHLSNGMGFSPDGSTFYHIDSIPRIVSAYDYDQQTGSIKNRRALIALTQDDGLPDGMTVDSEGFIWIALWFGGAVVRFDPDGKRERTIELPVAQPSSVMFGGPDLNELYITSAGLMWESPIAPAGHDYSRPRGGPLFRVSLDITGKPENQARV